MGANGTGPYSAGMVVTGFTGAWGNGRIVVARGFPSGRNWFPMRPRVSPS